MLTSWLCVAAAARPSSGGSRTLPPCAPRPTRCTAAGGLPPWCKAGLAVPHHRPEHLKPKQPNRPPQSCPRRRPPRPCCRSSASGAVQSPRIAGTTGAAAWRRAWMMRPREDGAARGPCEVCTFRPFAAGWTCSGACTPAATVCRSAQPQMSRECARCVKSSAQMQSPAASATRPRPPPSLQQAAMATPPHVLESHGATAALQLVPQQRL